MYSPFHMGWTTYLWDLLLCERVNRYIKYMIDFLQCETFTHMYMHENLLSHVSYYLFVRLWGSVCANKWVLLTSPKTYELKSKYITLIIYLGISLLYVSNMNPPKQKSKGIKGTKCKVDLLKRGNTKKKGYKN